MSNNKKDIFDEIRHYLFSKGDSELKISSLLTKDSIIEELKTLKVIELDNLESFDTYINYDHFLIFKNNDNFYFCDTELTPGLKNDSMIKLTDFNVYLRKDKIKRIQNEK